MTLDHLEPVEQLIDADLPSLSCVVLNYGTPDDTLRAVDSVLQSDYPLEKLRIWVVDNPAGDDSAEVLRRELPPSVELVEMTENVGYGGGNNAVLDRLTTEAAFVLNSDARVDTPESLRFMAARLMSDEQIGAVAPKIVFDAFRVRISLEADPTFLRRTTLLDSRVVGVAVFGVRVNGEEVAWEEIGFDSGFHVEESIEGRRYRWAEPAAELTIPATGEAMVIELAVVPPETTGEKVVRIRVGDDEAEHTLAPLTQAFASTRRPELIAVETEDPPLISVINNAGSAIVDGFHGCDIGFGQEDIGQFDEVREVFAFCGAAVMLKAHALSEVGTFDDRFFLYYEDTDLSWRLQKAGYRIIYEPRTRVTHGLSASTGGEGSRVFEYHVLRNRLLMLAKNASPKVLRRAVGGHSLTLIRQVKTLGTNRGREATRIRSEVLVDFLKARGSMRPKDGGPT